MNKEQLKELIRQELEEHLYAHPSKHKGGFAHPGSQPHVKDAKKNAKKKKKTREGLFMGPSKDKSKPKTVNVRHKTSGKELVIQDNPTNIKKYKKLGYTMWVGSRGKYESVNERMIQEHDRKDILKHLVKKGSNKKDAEELLDKHYDYLEKRYRKASVAKKAEVLVTLGALDAGR